MENGMKEKSCFKSIREDKRQDIDTLLGNTIPRHTYVQSSKGMKVTALFVCRHSANANNTNYTEKGLLNKPGIQVEALITAGNPLIYLDSPRCLPLENT
jgi:hypothetical protein